MSRSRSARRARSRYRRENLEGLCGSNPSHAARRLAVKRPARRAGHGGPRSQRQTLLRIRGSSRILRTTDQEAGDSDRPVLEPVAPIRSFGAPTWMFAYSPALQGHPAGHRAFGWRPKAPVTTVSNCLFSVCPTITLPAIPLNAMALWFPNQAWHCPKCGTCFLDLMNSSLTYCTMDRAYGR